MGQPLFEITKQYLNLINEIEDAGGEISEEVEKLLFINGEEFADKMNAYQRIIKSKQADIDAKYKPEIERLQKMIESNESTIERLRVTMKNALLLLGDTGKSGNKTLRTDLYNFFTKDTYTVEVDPIQFSMGDERTYPYAKVKATLELRPDEYQLILKILANSEEMNAVTFNKVNECKLSYDPDKKELTRLLKEVEAKKGELPFTETEELPEGVTEVDFEEPDAIPGVKLVINTSIQVK